MEMTSTLTPNEWLETRANAVNQPGSVLFHAGAGVFQVPGGGEIQLIKTGMALEDRGHQIGLFNQWRDSLKNARLLHLFGLHPEGLALARLANAAKTGVVVSPICWYDPVAQWHEANGWIRGFIGHAKWLMLRHMKRLRKCAWRSQLLSLADAVLPNSHEEACQLVNLLGVDPMRIHVIPNAVDTEIPDKVDAKLARQAFGFDEYVLYTGRIEPRKNVLGLIKAVNRCKLPLVIVGQSPLEFREYELECWREASNGAIHFAGYVTKDNPLLNSAYLAARVFALPSWFETPGLAALEAASFSTPVVITSRGSTREYFRDHVIYCDPARPKTIEAAIRKAWNNPPAELEVLANKIRTTFNWNETARITEGIYDVVAP